MILVLEIPDVVILSLERNCLMEEERSFDKICTFGRVEIIQRYDLGLYVYVHTALMGADVWSSGGPGESVRTDRFLCLYILKVCKYCS